ncbi:MAG: hypothetical protein Q9M15_00920 [Mariprofundaceae bacterium]|nr:hypothetical protein [Mariprofundaceae bacterium]
MGYIDKTVLQDGFLSENQPSLQELMETVDQNIIEQDILEDGGDVFQAFLSSDEQDDKARAAENPNDHDLDRRIALAKEAVLHGDIDKIPVLFDDKLQLYMHHPEQGALPTFDSEQVQAFYMLVGRYYVERKQLAHAIKCYFLVKQANHHSPYLDRLAHAIFGAEVSDFLQQNFEGKRSSRRSS